MKELLKELYTEIKNDFYKKTFLSAGVSFLVCLAFASFNGYLGISELSIWHGTICVYYLLILIIRILLILMEIKANKKQKESIREAGYIISFIVLLIISVSLVTPVIVMLQNRREVNIGLIPAITVAAFTFYSLVMAIINSCKARKSDNLFVKQNRLINIISALVSILTLQNTLIVVNGGYEEDTIILSSVSSFIILVFIIFLIIYCFVKNMRQIIIKKKELI